MWILEEGRAVKDQVLGGGVLTEASPRGRLLTDLFLESCSHCLAVRRSPAWRLRSVILVTQEPGGHMF